MKFVQTKRGATLEAIIYPLLVIILMWSVFFVDRYYHLDLYKYGVKPGTAEGLKGIIFMPFIHGQGDFSHIINNSIPTFIFLSALIYFYREIALYVVLFIWLGGGFLLWYLAGNIHSYHIGMSGVIYGLFGFLFMSGILRRYLPLQAIALFVAFVYGSMIWGIFPIESRISWEGHLVGLLVGILIAFVFRKQGPKPPKYRYEIEKEMGIEPPDLEGEWLERKRRWEELQNKSHEEDLPNSANNSDKSSDISIEYHFKSAEKKKDDKKKKN
ncbi:MAG: rhomboid family intramembrane serine protease [Brumimicrobium sp.]|nr:rhomboid family intramembrane serine protease [Brumimicrobium sp.]